MHQASKIAVLVSMCAEEAVVLSQWLLRPFGAAQRCASAALEAGATQARRLEGVGCRPMFGQEARPPWPLNC